MVPVKFLIFNCAGVNDGAVYVGEFAQDVMHGKGKFTYANGTTHLL